MVPIDFNNGCLRPTSGYLAAARFFDELQAFLDRSPIAVRVQYMGAVFAICLGHARAGDDLR